MTYSGNSISANDKYGFLITQSYSEDFGTPGTESTVSNINFTGSKTTVTTTGKFPVVGIDCGHCTGTWNWAELDATGGEASDLVLTGGVKVCLHSRAGADIIPDAVISQISGGTF